MAGSEMEKAVQKLLEREPGWKEFLPKPASPVPDSAGKGSNAVPKGGAAGDLVEAAYSTRTYYARRTLRSTDGIITLLFDPIKDVTMMAGGSAVKWTFSEPTS